MLAGRKTPYMEKDYGNRMKYEGYEQPLITKLLPLQRCKERSGPRLAKGMDGSSCQKEIRPQAALTARLWTHYTVL